MPTEWKMPDLEDEAIGVSSSSETRTSGIRLHHTRQRRILSFGVGLPGQTMNIRYVKYHSIEWQELVEQGWITWSVDSRGVAKMVLNRRQK
jgi:hypothetical protein